MKWQSDQAKTQAAITSIDMANELAGGTPSSITLNVQMQDGIKKIAPQVVLTPGTQAFDNTLQQITTKLNNDAAAAQTWLTSVGVTND